MNTFAQPCFSSLLQKQVNRRQREKNGFHLQSAKSVTVCFHHMNQKDYPLPYTNTTKQAWFVNM